jgi:hypothetical protein
VTSHGVRRMAAATGFVLVGIGVPASAEGSVTSAIPAQVRHVVVVGVPGLTWSEVTRTQMPFLYHLVGHAAVASLSVRSADSVTRRADGWLTLGSGDRALAFPSATTPAVRAATMPDIADAVSLDRLRRLNTHSSFAAHIGALSAALAGSGRRIATVGPVGARLAAAGDVHAPAVVARSVGSALSEAAVVLDESTSLYAARMTAAGPSAAHEADATIRAAARAVGSDDVLLVVGVSDRSTGRATLTVAVESGPTAPGRWLESSSTGRSAYVQLVDVAPTVLTALGEQVPPTMIGQPWRSVGQRARGDAASTLHTLVGAAREAHAQLVSSRWYRRFVLVLGGVLLLVVAGARVTGRWSPTVPAIALSTASLPVAGWLVQLFPWWRWGTWTLIPLTLGLAGLVGGGGLWVWRRYGAWAGVAVVAGTSALVEVADAVSGSRLQLDAPFGDNPIIAGRFHGLGNGAFAVLGASALVAAAALASRSRPPVAAAVVAGIGVVATAVDVLPAFGDDFGGVLALVPALAVLALLVGRLRLTVHRFVVAGAAALAVAVAVAFVDYRRPASSQTHLGRFVGQLRHGTAGPLLHRKFASSLATFTHGDFRWFVLVALLVVGVLATQVRDGRLRAVDGVDVVTVRAAGLSIVVLAALGSLLNDSGLEVAALAFLAGLPLAAVLLVRSSARLR